MLSRKYNLFEKLLLPVGFGLTFFGFYLIFLAEKLNTQTAWIRLSAVFSWMILLFLIIISSATENMKEELLLIQKEHSSEIKLLRDITHEQLEEIKLLRQELKIKR
ncbi:MAG: hypothetical protein QXE31_02470 [Candidatus Woesearchaeota archaeon]